MSYFDTHMIFDVIGVAGFLLYLAAYLALTLRWISAPSAMYFLINLLAASCMLISLSTNFNLGSALVQIFWVGISLVGLSMLWRARQR